ncbi:hypothetical protein BUMB_04469c [Candidatus Paraburkholderia calva]|nr:hypothetical protein BUMB_04469c [Candidatus Paraburkholderia calva]
MENTTYTKGIYTATIGVRATDSGQFQGLVSLNRDDGESDDATLYEVKSASGNESEALEEARAGASHPRGHRALDAGRCAAAAVRCLRLPFCIGGHHA